MKGKRVFKTNSAPRKRKSKEDQGVLQFREWQKDIAKVFSSLERKFKRWHV